MSKFSLKAEHFITPIKLVLPGIIVSLVGATSVFFLFNNPKKNKAKNTYQVWNVIREYEDAFSKGTQDAFCMADSLDQLTFRKDYTHLLEILINNLEDLKGNDDVDTRLKAFLNIKIARYSNAKKLTDTYLDTLLPLNAVLLKDPGNESLRQIALNEQEKYISELAHIETRDTSELKRIAAALNKEHISYTDSFLLNTEIRQPLAEMKKYFIGKWHFPEIAVTAEIKKDSTGIWEVEGRSIGFKWTMDERIMTFNFKTNETHHFRLIKATPDIFSAIWKERDFVLLGCRRGEAR